MVDSPFLFLLLLLLRFLHLPLPRPRPRRLRRRHPLTTPPLPPLLRPLRRPPLLLLLPSLLLPSRLPAFARAAALFCTPVERTRRKRKKKKTKRDANRHRSRESMMARYKKASVRRKGRVRRYWIEAVWNGRASHTLPPPHTKSSSWREEVGLRRGGAAHSHRSSPLPGRKRRVPPSSGL